MQLGAAMWRVIIVVLFGCCADATPVASSHDVSIIVEPDGRKGQQILDAIGNAQHAISVELYQLGDRRVIDALAARAKDGVDVTVVLDGSAANREWNQDAYDRLHAAGARVGWSNPSFTYTHTKVIVADDAAWIMTMNANVSSPLDNREYLAIDRDPADVAEARAIVAADLAGTSPDTRGDLVVSNANARPRIGALIQSARATLDVEVEELGDGSIAALIARAARDGVRVRVVLARADLTPWQLDAVDAILQAGGRVVESGPDANHRDPDHPYIHAKTIIVDGEVAFVGSENLSSTSLGANREVGVVVSDPHEVGKIVDAVETDFEAGTGL